MIEFTGVLGDGTRHFRSDQRHSSPVFHVSIVRRPTIRPEPFAGRDPDHPNSGVVLNVASLSALTPVPGLALYAATKAAVLSYTTSVQGDLRHAGLPVRVRALCPDVVGTRMVTARAADPGAALLFAGPKPWPRTPSPAREWR